MNYSSASLISLLNVKYLLPGNDFGNHTTFGFCNDSLNSVKYIREHVID